MLSVSEATKLVERETGEKVVVCVPYKNNYLVRVQHASIDEQDFDPFYHVDSNTGMVKEFSVITDGDPIEIQEAFSSVTNR